MSVVVLGMDIPQDCNHCRFVNLDTAACMATHDDVPAQILGNSRPWFCPLRPNPLDTPRPEICQNTAYSHPLPLLTKEEFAEGLESFLLFGDPNK